MYWQEWGMKNLYRSTALERYVNGSKNSLLERAINYFGDSNNCGIYLSRETVAGQLDVTVEQIETMIGQ